MELSRILLIIVSFGTAFLVIGCESRRPGPYTSSTTKDAVIVRDSAAAQKLLAKAAECQESEPLEAEDLLRQALDADLYNGMAHNNLGVLLLNRGELYAAVHEFEWARKLLPGHPKPRINLAIALNQADKHAEAIEAAKAALEVEPGNLDALITLCFIQVSAKLLDEQTESRLASIFEQSSDETWRLWAKENRLKLEAKQH